MNLLINADDLGYTPAINQIIFDIFNRGQLCSASLLANMQHRQHAIQNLKHNSALKIGCHLNLTKGHPVQPLAKIPSIVNSSGTFWPTKQFYARAIAGLINLDEMKLELSAQIEILLDYGIQPTHLDSHSHWHTLPHLRKVVTRLVEGYQIPGIRQAAPQRTLLPSHLWLAAAARNTHPQTNLRIPDYSLSLHQWMGADGQPIDLFFSEQLRHLIARPEVTLELVTHPGKICDPDFPTDSLQTHQRQWEVDFLLSTSFAKWLEMMNAKIVSYEAL